MLDDAQSEAADDGAARAPAEPRAGGPEPAHSPGDPQQTLSYGRPIRHRRGRRLLGLAALGIVCAGLLSQHHVAYYRITSGSMLPTLAVGAEITVDRGMRSPSVGEIVVFHPPAGAAAIPPVCAAPDEGNGSPQPCDLPEGSESTEVFVKRVVAVGGETVALRGGQAVVNGVIAREPDPQPCLDPVACSFPTPVTVPVGDYYMLGDNRAASDDSRFWGPVPSAWIIGTVVRCSLLDTVCHAVR